MGGNTRASFGVVTVGLGLGGWVPGKMGGSHFSNARTTPGRGGVGFGVSSKDIFRFLPNQPVRESAKMAARDGPMKEAHPIAFSSTALVINMLIAVPDHHNAVATVDQLRMPEAREAIQREARRDNTIDPMAMLVVNALTDSYEAERLETSFAECLVKSGAGFTNWTLSPSTVLLLSQLSPLPRKWASDIIPSTLPGDIVNELKREHQEESGEDEDEDEDIDGDDTIDKPSVTLSAFSQTEGKPKKKETINMSTSMVTRSKLRAAAAASSPSEEKKVPTRKRKREGDDDDDQDEYSLEMSHVDLEVLELSERGQANDDAADLKPEPKRTKHEEITVAVVRHVILPPTLGDDNITDKGSSPEEYDSALNIFASMGMNKPLPPGKGYRMVGKFCAVEHKILRFFGLELTKKLGSGSYGTTWLGYLNGQGEKAIKFVPIFESKSYTSYSNVGPSAKDEVNAGIVASSLFLGPRIYQVFYLPCSMDPLLGAGGTRTKFEPGYAQVIVMDRITATFQEWMNDLASNPEKVDARLAEEVGIKLLKMFATARTCHFYHFDVKTDNVGVVYDRETLQTSHFRLIDFGMSHHLPPGAKFEEQLWPNRDRRFGWFVLGPKTNTAPLASDYDLITFFNSIADTVDPTLMDPGVFKYITDVLEPAKEDFLRRTYESKTILQSAVRRFIEFLEQGLYTFPATRATMFVAKYGKWISTTKGKDELDRIFAIWEKDTLPPGTF